MFNATTRRITRWIVLLPVLMVGSLFFWSLAIGLGGLSLMAASALSTVPGPNDTIELGASFDVQSLQQVADETQDRMGPATIQIHLEESTEPEDVNDNSGAAGFSAPADDQSIATPGPGATSY